MLSGAVQKSQPAVAVIPAPLLQTVNTTLLADTGKITTKNLLSE